MSCHYPLAFVSIWLLLTLCFYEKDWFAQMSHLRGKGQSCIVALWPAASAVARLPAGLALCASAGYWVWILETSLKPQGVDIPVAIHDKGCSNTVFSYDNNRYFYNCSICLGVFGFVYSTGRDCNPHQNKQGTDGRTCWLFECFVVFLFPALVNWNCPNCIETKQIINFYTFAKTKKKKK